MTILAILIPVALCLGAVGLVVFFWTLRNGQYDDLTGDAERILFDEDTPLMPVRKEAARPEAVDRPLS